MKQIVPDYVAIITEIQSTTPCLDSPSHFFEENFTIKELESTIYSAFRVDQAHPIREGFTHL